MAQIVSQTDKLPNNTYPDFTYKTSAVLGENVLVAAHVGAANASNAFDEMKADVLSNLAGATITRIRVIVTTTES